MTTPAPIANYRAKPVPAGTLSPERMRAESRARVESAMRRVERAQREFESACGDLSALCGGTRVWKATHVLTDKIHTHWYKLQSFMRSGKYHLDDANVQGILEREAQAAANRGHPT